MTLVECSICVNHFYKYDCAWNCPHCMAHCCYPCIYKQINIQTTCPFCRYSLANTNVGDYFIDKHIVMRFDSNEWYDTDTIIATQLQETYDNTYNDTYDDTYNDTSGNFCDDTSGNFCDDTSGNFCDDTCDDTSGNFCDDTYNDTCYASFQQVNETYDETKNITNNIELFIQNQCDTELVHNIYEQDADLVRQTYELDAELLLQHIKKDAELVQQIYDKDAELVN
jgi:hypothetical protein